MKNELHILPSFRIDKEKWNNCLKTAANRLVYASAEYLDAMADNWSGIIINDYEAVMPVPWRKKYGIVYCYDVPFVQQLGFFSGKHDFVADEVVPALHLIFRYGHYYFNFNNFLVTTEPMVNYILPLHKNYDHIFSNFSASVQQDIKKSLEFDLQYTAGEIGETIELFRQLYGHRAKIGKREYDQFENLCLVFLKSGNAIVKKVSDSSNNVLATALLLVDDARVYNMINAVTDEGRKKKANYLLYSSIFRDFQQADWVFDFEGSHIPGVGEFYRKFGAVNQPYFRSSFNLLPWPLSLYKK